MMFWYQKTAAKKKSILNANNFNNGWVSAEHLKGLPDQIRQELTEIKARNITTLTTIQERKEIRAEQ